MLSPVYYLANLPSEIASWADSNLISRNDLLDENRTLKDTLLILQAQNQRLIGLESENARLRFLLGSSRQLKGKRLVAEIINVNSGHFSQERMLNKGSQDNVYVGQPVVDAAGFLGQITEVSANHSRMILLNDDKHAIPIRNDRNGIRAIAQGNGLSLNLRHLPNTVDIKEGDLLLSSGLGQKFPDGYPVARVTSVIKQTTQPYAEIIAEPTASIATSDHVLLLWYKNKESLETNEPPQNTQSTDTADEEINSNTAKAGDEDS